MCGDRRQARGYPSDLTDAQWQVIEPYLPARAPGGRGRPRIWPLRRITEAILYVDRAGCAWRYLPADFPPWRTVYGYFAAWRDDGTLARLHDGLRAQVRAVAGRDAEPTAAVIDSQSVRAADTVPKASRGWDNAKKVNGRKRHIAVDTAGLILAVVVTAASVKTATPRSRCCGTWPGPAPASSWPGPTRVTPASSPAGPLPACASPWRSSASATRTPSRSCPAAGSWNGRWPGSPATAAAPATTNVCPPATKRWCCGR